MTVEEAYQSYGAKVYVTSEGDSLPFLTRIIYKSDSDMWMNVLQVLNPHVNWLSLGAGEPILYLDASMINEELF